MEKSDHTSVDGETNNYTKNEKGLGTSSISSFQSQKKSPPRHKVYPLYANSSTMCYGHALHLFMQFLDQKFDCHPSKANNISNYMKSGEAFRDAAGKTNDDIIGSEILNPNLTAKIMQNVPVHHQTRINSQFIPFMFDHCAACSKQNFEENDPSCNNIMYLSQILEKLIVERDMSKAEFARFANMAVATLFGLLRGNRPSEELRASLKYIEKNCHLEDGSLTSYIGTTKQEATLSEHLRQIHDEHKLSFAALAETAGVPPGTLNDWVYRNCRPSEKFRASLERIETRYGKSKGSLTSFLIDRTRSEPSKQQTRLGKTIQEQFAMHGFTLKHFEKVGISGKAIWGCIHLGSMFSKNNRKKLRYLDRAFGFQEGYLQSLIIEPSLNTGPDITGLARAGTPYPTICKIKNHLSRDFEKKSREEQIQQVKFVEDNLIYTFDDEGDPEGFERSYTLILTEPDENDPRARAPQHIIDVLKRIKTHKTKTAKSRGEFRKNTWSKVTADKASRTILQFFGALVMSGYPVEKLTYQLIFTAWAWDAYIDFMKKRLNGMITKTITETLSLFSSLTREKYGYITQFPDISDLLQLDRKLEPIQDFVTQSEVDSLYEVPTGISKQEQTEILREKWIIACKATNEHLLDTIEELNKELSQGRYPFDSIWNLLNENSNPFEIYYTKIVRQLRDRTPHQDNKRSWAKHQRDNMLFRLPNHTPLRSKNFAQLLMSPNIRDENAKNRSNRWLESNQKGEIRGEFILDEKSGRRKIDPESGRPIATRYYLMMPKTAFKNRKSKHAIDNFNEIELLDVDGLYDEISTYIFEARETVIDGRNDTGEFFISTKGKHGNKISYTSTGISMRYKHIMQNFGVYNPYTGLGAIAGMKAHRLHTVRHIIATSSIKQNNGVAAFAAALLFDNENTVKQAYALFNPVSAHEASVKKMFNFLNSPKVA